MEELQTPEGEKLNFILLKVEMIVGPTANTFCSHNTNKTPQDLINQLVFQIKSSAREERLVFRPLQTHLSSHIYFNNKSREMKLIQIWLPLKLVFSIRIQVVVQCVREVQSAIIIKRLIQSLQNVIHIIKRCVLKVRTVFLFIKRLQNQLEFSVPNKIL